jgi:hypothetical protein
MLYSEIIAVCSQIHTKHINTLCGQNVPRSKHSFSVIKTNQLMMYSEIIAVCSQIHQTHKYTAWAELRVSENGIYSHHRTSELIHNVMKSCLTDKHAYHKRNRCPCTGLDRSRGLQEVEAPTILINMHRPFLSRGKNPGLISIRDLVDCSATERPEGLTQGKISKTTKEIEPATYRLVAQCLNQLRYRVSPSPPPTHAHARGRARKHLDITQNLRSYETWN